MRRHENPPRIRHTTAAIQQAAVRMRWQPTPAEAVLWNALKGRQLAGLRFRRQHPVGRFILDFYCPAKKLVVELDGAIHIETEQADYDAARTAQLEAHGYRVIRFRNEEVMADVQSVLDRIVAAALGPSEPILDQSVTSVDDEPNAPT